jgi:hypothetical protein
VADPITSVEAEFTLLKRHFTGVKRRVAQRYRCPLATLGRLVFADGRTEEVWAHNLSETGIGLNMPHALDPGTAVLIRLKGSTQNLAVALAAVVIHSTRELDGSWRVGCAFDRKLTPEEMDALL